MTLTNQKVNALKHRQNSQKDPSTTVTALSMNETMLLNRIVTAQQNLLREKAITEDVVDVIENTERQIKDMHFQDTHQVKAEIEEAKKEYMSEKHKYEDVMRKKQEIA